MSWISRITRSLFANSVNTRSFALYPRLQLREVYEEQKGNETVIRAEYIQSPRETFLVKNNRSDTCSLCSSGLNLKHTDVLILSQFVRTDGCMLPRRVTRLCRTQQKKVSALVTMAQKAGLMPNLNPSWSKKDPKKRYGWKKYNKYFDESTIKL